MADEGDDSVSEDQWLYGDSNPDQPNENTESGVNDPSKNIDSFINPDGPPGIEPQPPGVLEPPVIHPPSQNGEAEQAEQNGDGEGEGNLQIDEGLGQSAMENGEPKQPESGEFDEDDDSEDDTVNVVIGDIRTAPQYSSLNIKRGGLLTTAGVPPQLKQPGKFSIEEFEQIGTINGVAAHEYNLDSLEDKPWRKPGSDITDYFNYGFNEDTWRAYCERQKRIRIHESGVGLGPLSSNVTAPMAGAGRAPVANIDKQYMVAPPQPGRRNTGNIDVIGGQSLPTRRTNESPPKENVIQLVSQHHSHHRHSSSGYGNYVMTADRREYSRKGFPDMMVPPPGGVSVPPPGFTPGMPPPHIPGGAPGFGGPYGAEFYSSEVDQYYAYEPTQDSQWSSTQAMDKVIKQEPMDGESTKEEERPRERERDRDRDRDRERDRDRHRDRERHRHRSRSRSTERRSRKHKSRSRSPGHRSHKKKKSKKSDRQKEETSD